MSCYKAPYPHELPTFDTATNVIDHLTEQVSDLIVISNFEGGVMLTAEEFEIAFARTFDAALTELLARLDRVRPELSARLRRKFVAEQDLSDC